MSNWVQAILIVIALIAALCIASYARQEYVINQCLHDNEHSRTECVQLLQPTRVNMSEDGT